MAIFFDAFHHWVSFQVLFSTQTPTQTNTHTNWKWHNIFWWLFMILCQSGSWSFNQFDCTCTWVLFSSKRLSFFFLLFPFSVLSAVCIYLWQKCKTFHSMRIDIFRNEFGNSFLWTQFRGCDYIFSGTNFQMADSVHTSTPTQKDMFAKELPPPEIRLAVPRLPI